MSSQCGLYKIYTQGVDKFGSYWLVLTDDVFIYTHALVVKKKWYISCEYKFNKRTIGNNQELRSLLC